MGEVIATKDLVVHDDAMGIDRKLVKGQPVPPDLVPAYKREGGEVPDDWQAPQAQSVQTSDTEVIAKQSVIVHNKAMGIDQKLFAGQAVPADLVPAYRRETGDDAEVPAAAEPVPGTSGSSDEGDGERTWSADDSVESLQDEVDQRIAAGRDIKVEGSGSNGNVIKADLIAALEADDQSD